jgi:hypothetical protein
MHYKVLVIFTMKKKPEKEKWIKPDKGILDTSMMVCSCFHMYNFCLHHVGLLIRLLMTNVNS